MSQTGLAFVQQVAHKRSGSVNIFVPSLKLSHLITSSIPNMFADFLQVRHVWDTAQHVILKVHTSYIRWAIVPTGLLSW